MRFFAQIMPIWRNRGNRLAIGSLGVFYRND